MYNPSYQKSNHRLWAMLMLLVLLALSGIGVASARQISAPGENPANDFVSEPAGNPAIAFVNEPTGLEFSDGGDPAATFGEVDGDAWIDNPWMRNLVVRDAPAASGSGSRVDADPGQADRLIYKFLVILGLADS